MVDKYILLVGLNVSIAINITIAIKAVIAFLVRFIFRFMENNLAQIACPVGFVAVLARIFWGSARVGGVFVLKTDRNG